MYKNLSYLPSSTPLYVYVSQGHASLVTIRSQILFLFSFRTK